MEVEEAQVGGLFIGLMSGTSLDGVDGVLVRFPSPAPGDHGETTPRVQILASTYAPFPAALKDSLLSLQTPGENEMEKAALASNELAKLYATCCHALLKDAQLQPPEVTAIGVHGQTVRHNPSAGYTVQLNNPSLLAELTNIDVVADFRSRDVAAGGQGAPLVPRFHAELLQHRSKARVVCNIGGIANITVLPPASSDSPVFGYDTGPGNVLLDSWATENISQPYDEDGAWASEGAVDDQLLASLISDPYFSRPAPKSTGRDYFNLTWLEGKLSAHGFVHPINVQATLTLFTAQSIADELKKLGLASDCELILCGGGSKNSVLVSLLRIELPGVFVTTTEAVCGLRVDLVEACAFAWLAKRHVDGQPGNLPRVTGSKGDRVLGCLYPR